MLLAFDPTAKIRGAKIDFLITDDLLDEKRMSVPTKEAITNLYFSLRTIVGDVQREKKLLDGDQSRDVVREADDKTLARLLRARRSG